MAFDGYDFKNRGIGGLYPILKDSPSVIIATISSIFLQEKGYNALRSLAPGYNTHEIGLFFLRIVRRFCCVSEPSVSGRGFFLNDWDWGFNSITDMEFYWTRSRPRNQTTWQ